MPLNSDIRTKVERWRPLQDWQEGNVFVQRRKSNEYLASQVHSEIADTLPLRRLMNDRRPIPSEGVRLDWIPNNNLEGRYVSGAEQKEFQHSVSNMKLPFSGINTPPYDAKAASDPRVHWLDRFRNYPQALLYEDSTDTPLIDKDEPDPSRKLGDASLSPASVEINGLTPPSPIVPPSYANGHAEGDQKTTTTSEVESSHSRSATSEQEDSPETDWYSHCLNHLKVIDSYTELQQGIFVEMKKQVKLDSLLNRKMLNKAERLTSLVLSAEASQAPAWIRKAFGDLRDHVTQQAQAHYVYVDALNAHCAAMQQSLNSHQELMNYVLQRASESSSALQQDEKDTTDDLDDAGMSFLQASGVFEEIRKPRIRLTNKLDFLKSQLSVTTTQTEEVELKILELKRNGEEVTNRFMLQDLKLRAEFLKGHMEQLKSDVQSAQMEIADYDFIYREKLLEVFNVFHQHRTRYDSALRNYFQLLSAVSLRDNNFTLELLRKEPIQEDKKQAAQTENDLSDVSKCSGDNSNTSMSNAAVFHASVTQASVNNKVNNGQGVSVNSNHQKLLNNAMLNLPSPSLEASPNKASRSPARATPENNPVVLIRVRDESFSSSSKEREFSEKSSQTEMSAAQRTPDTIEYKQSTAPGDGHRTIVLDSDSGEPRTVTMRDGKLEMDNTGDIASEIISRKYAEHHLQELGRQMTEIKVERGLIAKYSREPLDKGSDGVLNGDPAFDGASIAFEKEFSPMKKKKPADEPERNVGGRTFGMSLKNSLPNVRLSENYEIPSTSISHHGLHGHPHFVTSQQELRVSELISKYATPKMKTLGTNYNNCETIEERYVGADGIRDVEDELKFENITDNADLQSRIVKICAVRPIYPDPVTIASQQKQQQNIEAEAQSIVVSPESDDSRFAYLKTYEITAGLFTVPKENLAENCSGNNDEFLRIHFQDHKRAENDSRLSKELCSSQQNAYDRKSPQSARMTDESLLEMSRMNMDICHATPRLNTEVNRTTARCNMFQQECQDSTDDSSEEETIPKTLFSHVGQRNGAYESGLIDSGAYSDEITSTSQYEDCENFLLQMKHHEGGYIENSASPRPLKSSLKKDIQRYSDHDLSGIQSFVGVNPRGGFMYRELRDCGQDPRLFFSEMGLAGVGELNGAQDSRPSSRIAKRVRFDYIVTFNDNTQIDTQLAQLERELDERNDPFTAERCNRNGNNGNDMDALSQGQGIEGEDHHKTDRKAVYNLSAKCSHTDTVQQTLPPENAKTIISTIAHSSLKHKNINFSDMERGYNETCNNKREYCNVKSKGSVYFTLECSMPKSCPVKWTHTVSIPRKRFVFYSAYRYHFASKERQFKMQTGTVQVKANCAKHTRFTDTCDVHESDGILEDNKTPDKGSCSHRKSRTFDGVKVDKSIEARLFRKILKCKTTLLKVWKQRPLKVFSAVKRQTSSTKGGGEKLSFDSFVPTKRSYHNIGYLFSPDANCKKKIKDNLFCGHSLKCNNTEDGIKAPQFNDSCVLGNPRPTQNVVFCPHLSVPFMKPVGGDCEISESTSNTKTTHQSRTNWGWRNAMKRTSKRRQFDSIRKLCRTTKATDWPNRRHRCEQGKYDFRISAMRTKNVKHIRGKECYVNYAFHLGEDVDVSKKCLENTIENDGETWEDIVIVSDNDSDEEDLCWSEDMLKNYSVSNNIKSHNINNSALSQASKLASRSPMRKVTKKRLSASDTQKNDLTSWQSCRVWREPYQNLEKKTSFVKPKMVRFSKTRVKNECKSNKLKTTSYSNRNNEKSLELKNQQMKLLSRRSKRGQILRSPQPTSGKKTEIGRGNVFLQGTLFDRHVLWKHSGERFRAMPSSQVRNLVTRCRSWTMISMRSEKLSIKPKKSASFSIGTEMFQMVNSFSSNIMPATPFVRKRPNVMHTLKRVIHYVPWGMDNVHEKLKTELNPSPQKRFSLPLSGVHISPKSSPKTCRKFYKLKDLERDVDQTINLHSTKLNIELSSKNENTVTKTFRHTVTNNANGLENYENIAIHDNPDIQKKGIETTWRTTAKPQWQSKPSPNQPMTPGPEGKSCIKQLNLELVPTESSYYHRDTKPISITNTFKSVATGRREVSIENNIDPIKSLLSECLNPMMRPGDSQMITHGDSVNTSTSEYNKDVLGKSPKIFTGVVESLMVISKPLRLLPREIPSPRMCHPERSKRCKVFNSKKNYNYAENKVVSITSKQPTSYIEPIDILNFRLNSNDNGKFNFTDSNDLKDLTTESDERNLPLEILRSPVEEVRDTRHVENIKSESTIPSEILTHWNPANDQQTLQNPITLPEAKLDTNDHSSSCVCTKVCSNLILVNNYEPKKFIPLESYVSNCIKLNFRPSQSLEPCELHGDVQQLRPRNGKSQTKKSLAEARKMKLLERSVVQCDTCEWNNDIDKRNGFIIDQSKFGDYKYTEDKHNFQGTNTMNDRYGDLVPTNTPISLSCAESSSTLVEPCIESSNLQTDRLTLQMFEPIELLSSIPHTDYTCEKTTKNGIKDNESSGKLQNNQLLLEVQNMIDSRTSERQNATNDISFLVNDVLNKHTIKDSSQKSINSVSEPVNVFRRPLDDKSENLLISNTPSDTMKLERIDCSQQNIIASLESSVFEQEKVDFDKELQQILTTEKQPNSRSSRHSCTAEAKGRRSKEHRKRRSDFTQPNEAKHYFLPLKVKDVRIEKNPKTSCHDRSGRKWDKVTGTNNKTEDKQIEISHDREVYGGLDLNKSSAIMESYGDNHIVSEKGGGTCHSPRGSISQNDPNGDSAFHLTSTEYVQDFNDRFVPFIESMKIVEAPCEIQKNVVNLSFNNESTLPEFGKDDMSDEETVLQNNEDLLNEKKNEEVADKFVPNFPFAYKMRRNVRKHLCKSSRKRRRSKKATTLNRAQSYPLCPHLELRSLSIKPNDGLEKNIMEGKPSSNNHTSDAQRRFPQQETQKPDEKKSTSHESRTPRMKENVSEDLRTRPLTALPLMHHEQTNKTEQASMFNTVPSQLASPKVLNTKSAVVSPFYGRSNITSKTCISKSVNKSEEDGTFKNKANSISHTKEPKNNCNRRVEKTIANKILNTEPGRSKCLQIKDNKTPVIKVKISVPLPSQEKNSFVVNSGKEVFSLHREQQIRKTTSAVSNSQIALSSKTGHGLSSASQNTSNKLKAVSNKGIGLINIASNEIRDRCPKKDDADFDHMKQGNKRSLTTTNVISPENPFSRSQRKLTTPPPSAKFKTWDTNKPPTNQPKLQTRSCLKGNANLQTKSASSSSREEKKQHAVSFSEKLEHLSDRNDNLSLHCQMSLGDRVRLPRSSCVRHDGSDKRKGKGLENSRNCLPKGARQKIGDVARSQNGEYVKITRYFQGVPRSYEVSYIGKSYFDGSISGWQTTPVPGENRSGNNLGGNNFLLKDHQSTAKSLRAGVALKDISLYDSFLRNTSRRSRAAKKVLSMRSIDKKK